MRLELAAALVAPLLVAACAPQPQPVAAAPAEPRPPGPEYEAALHALIDCGLRQILRLDDGRSDAGLVARAAVARCAREKAGFEAVAMDRAATPRAAVPTAVEHATQSTVRLDRARGPRLPPRARRPALRRRQSPPPRRGRAVEYGKISRRHAGGNARIGGKVLIERLELRQHCQKRL